MRLEKIYMNSNVVNILYTFTDKKSMLLHIKETALRSKLICVNRKQNLIVIKAQDLIPALLSYINFTFLQSFPFFSTLRL